MIRKIVSIFLLLIVLIFIPSPAYAQQVKACNNPNVQTDPNPVLSNSPRGKFIIDVGNNREPGVNSWKMEFQCAPLGIKKSQVDATLEPGNTNIAGVLENSGTANYRCEFNSRIIPNQILVKRTIRGNDVPYCIASYRVRDGDSPRCEISISPDKDITIASNIVVSGRNITPGAKLLVFFDNDAVDITNRAQLDLPGYGNVQTPSFDNYKIPSNYMAEGAHMISLRQKNGDRDWFNPAKSEKDFFGPPLCSINFSIGNSSNPGQVGTPNNPQGCVGECTTAAGKTCNQAGYTGIETAIGCVPTQANVLVTQLMKFSAGIGGGIALLLMIMGAFQMLASAGNPEIIKKGREQFVSAGIGLVFVLLSALILKIIGIDILNIPGFG